MKSNKMDGWTKTNIDSVCRVGDGAHGSLKRYDQGILYLTSKNFKDDGLDLSKVDYIDEGTYQKYFKEQSGALTKPIEGDVLFSIIGSIGTPYIVKPSDRFGMSSSVAMLRPDDSAILSTYLFYWIKGHIFQDALYGIKGGVAQGYVSLEMIKSLPIHYPSLSTQQHIADILSSYDDLIENSTRRIHILEQMTQAIYQEWFGKVDKELLPDGWEVKPFGELLSFDVNGGWGEEEQSEQFSVPAYVIRGTDIPSGRYGQFDKVPFRYHKQTNFKSRQLLLGDIVIEIAGGSKGQPVGRALLIGKGILHRFNGQAICASFCKLVRPNQDIVSPEYLYMHLREIYQNGEIEKYQTQSTGIINFKSSFFLEDNMVIVPDKAKMDEFTEIIRPMFQMIETLGSKNTNLRQTRDLLLPRLISGEIELQ